MEQQSRRKRKKGVVVSTKMKDTVVVNVERKIQHPRYKKVVGLKKKYYAHTVNKELAVGDTVVIEETRPISKLKAWRVV